MLQKSIWSIKAQIRDIHKKLGINNNVELTLFLLCDRTKRNFDLKEIRKHSIDLFFSMWIMPPAVTKNNQIDMRRCRVRSNARTSVRATRNRKDCDSFYIV